MTPARRLFLGVALAALAAGGGAWWWDDRPNYIPPELPDFMAQIPAPPARDSAETRRELGTLLELQRTRTAADVAAAQADRKTDIARFYGALGLDENDPPRLPHLRRLAERVEDDVRPHVRFVKRHYRRLRPYEIEPRIEPCIGDVKGDLSYPSGHAAYGYAMGLMLADLVPERREQLEARAAGFARQRMVCGVHFPSDLRAGEIAARLLLTQIAKQPAFQRDAALAAQELREARAARPGR